jgi:hypothetical protein
VVAVRQLALWEHPGYWVAVHDGNHQAFNLFQRHYSYQPYLDGRRQLHGYRNRFLICGPGEKMVLLGYDCAALFVWRKFIDSCPGQFGVNCAVFRNESTRRASDLIRAAVDLAWHRWPGERLYTYVDSRKVRGTCPGYCFRRAGWKHEGETGSGLMIFVREP